MTFRMVFDITETATLLLKLCVAIATAFLIPLVKSRVDQDKFYTTLRWVKIAVAAAEQVIGATDGAKKKQYVINYLEARGIYLCEEDIDVAIEAAVLELHNALYGTQEGDSNVQQS